MHLRVWRRKLLNHFTHWPQCVASIKSCQVKQRALKLESWLVTLIHLGQVNPSEMRRERTNYNVEQAQKKFQQDGEKTLNPNLFEMVFHSFFSDEIDFESNMESFNMDDHM